MLWIEEHYQYAMWVLGSDEEDAEESNRENQEGSVRGSPTHGGNRHLDWASRSVEEIYGAKPVQVSSGALHAGEINQKLVASGVVVSKLRPVQWLWKETFRS